LNLLPVPDLSYELALIARGFDRVAGVDEAGRGPLAGPVVAAAVILPKKFSCEWLDDSKKMPKKRREIVYEKLVGDEAVVWAVGVVDAGEIDALNILRATHVAMGEAIDGLGVRPDMALVDGLRVKGLSVEHEALVKGDGKSLSIAAASVIAKVTRDRMMERMDEEFPEYGFIRNQGYGTKEHLEALKKYGPCRYHRRSFEPVSQLTLPFG
jgi:ribonuclease HII